MSNLIGAALATGGMNAANGILQNVLKPSGTISESKSSEIGLSSSESNGNSWESGQSSSWSDAWSKSSSSSKSVADAWQNGESWNEAQAQSDAIARTYGREASAQDILNAEAANAQQEYFARLQMAYNSAEAEKARNFEEMMSNTSYQRVVKDLLAAGINPILAVQQGGASTPSAVQASSGMAAANKANAYAESESKSNSSSWSKGYSYNKGESHSKSSSKSNSESKSTSGSQSTNSGGSKTTSSSQSNTNKNSSSKSEPLNKGLINAAGNAVSKVVNAIKK